MRVDQQQLMDTDMESAVAQAVFLETVQWSLLLSGVIACLLTGFFVTRSITRPILTASSELAEGSSQVPSAADQVSDAAQSLAAR